MKCRDPKRGTYHLHKGVHTTRQREAETPGYPSLLFLSSFSLSARTPVLHLVGMGPRGAFFPPLLSSVAQRSVFV